MLTYVFNNSNLSQEIFAIDTWGAIICSLGHGRKHMLTILPTTWRPSFRGPSLYMICMINSFEFEESQMSWQLFCCISMIQVCNTTWDKAGNIPSMVTAIIAAGKNGTINYSAGEACDVVIKVIRVAKELFCKAIVLLNLFDSDLQLITMLLNTAM